MRISILAAATVALCTTISAGSAFADQATLSNCTNMQQQVRVALDANQQSSNYQEANKEQSYGRAFCTNSFYQKGVDHYSRALALLGVAPAKG